MKANRPLQGTLTTFAPLRGKALGGITNTELAMTLKEKIENSLTFYTLGMLAAGFLAGLAVYRGVLEIAGPKPQSEVSCTNQTAWEPPARKANWIPQAECPAYPLVL